MHNLIHDLSDSLADTIKNIHGVSNVHINATLTGCRIYTDIYYNENSSVHVCFKDHLDYKTNSLCICVIDLNPKSITFKLSNNISTKEFDLCNPKSIDTILDFIKRIVWAKEFDDIAEIAPAGFLKDDFTWADR